MGKRPRGAARLFATEAACYSDHTEVSFSPGIAYMPKTWAAGEYWHDSGTSATVYSDNGVPVCAGTNTWVSAVEGLVRMPGGSNAVHARTNETQTLTAIPGAPASSSCPTSQQVQFHWQENFYLATPIDVRTANGKMTGMSIGLARSVGGNPVTLQATGHPDWDSLFTKWEQLPPLNVGTLSTPTVSVANGSTGNTITFTYTAPPDGLVNGTLKILVPPGWTPPVTANGPGCTESTAGDVAINGQAITVSDLSLHGNSTADISYGAVSGGACGTGDGATASTTPGAPVWRAEVHSPSEPFTNFPGTPAIKVEAPSPP